MLETAARASILRKIAAATRTVPDAAAAASGWAAIERGFSVDGTASREAVVALLVDRLRDYDAQVEGCAAADVAARVAALLTRRGMRRLVVPAGMPAEALPAGFAFTVDEAGALTPAALDGFDGVVTLCTTAIAETGTLVLQHGPGPGAGPDAGHGAGQGRRALTLVPDYHLCIVDVRDVVATVPEALARLQATASLATTFVSGPSATADIEMTRIKGVHGPRFLDVLLVGAAADS